MKFDFAAFAYILFFDKFLCVNLVVYIKVIMLFISYIYFAKNLSLNVLEIEYITKG